LKKQDNHLQGSPVALQTFKDHHGIAEIATLFYTAVNQHSDQYIDDKSRQIKNDRRLPIIGALFHASNTSLLLLPLANASFTSI
jgi:hypothetical protein